MRFNVCLSTVGCTFDRLPRNTPNSNIYVFAGGNGGSFDDCNCDGYVNRCGFVHATLSSSIVVGHLFVLAYPFEQSLYNCCPLVRLAARIL
jgi:hypothetical protein